MSDLARTHWVGDWCVPPHSTEPAVLPPISDSTVTPVASEGTMRLRRERDEARAEVERLRKHRDALSAMIQRLHNYLDSVGLNSWKHGACWAAEDAIKNLLAEVERLRDEAKEREATLAKWIKVDEGHVRELIRLEATIQRVRDLPVYALLTTTEPDVPVVRKSALDAALDGEQDE